MPGMNQGLRRIILSLPAALLIFAGLSGPADTYHVGVDGSGFSPATLTVKVGDTVVWENTDVTDFSHTTTSDLSFFDPNYWDYTLVSSGDTFSRTFNNVGTFSYHDTADIGTGTIIVNALNVTPAISLESPRLVAGQFLFDAAGLTAGKTNVLQASNDLTSWAAIQTNVAAAASLTF